MYVGPLEEEYFQSLRNRGVDTCFVLNKTKNTLNRRRGLKLQLFSMPGCFYCKPIITIPKAMLRLTASRRLCKDSFKILVEKKSKKCTFCPEHYKCRERASVQGHSKPKPI